ncbi:MAG: GGDEF domain-containing response regulator [Chloroflexi bacterium]|nr:GGDEF domain-containing response regulator [Chloroflexota bacterium]
MVDDDEDDYLIVRDILEESPENKYTLEWLPEYEKGLQLASNGNHDVIILDYHLGGKTGLDLLTTLRDKGSSLPVILLTGAGDYSIDTQAMELGATAYLDKNTLTYKQLDRSIRYSLSQYSQLKYLQDLSMTDQLTGLHNRRGLIALSEQHWRVAQREEALLCLFLMDLDKFKETNDTSGHQVGDEFLIAFAETLNANFRGSDIICRLGGDEFAVLAIISADADSKKQLKRLDKHVAEFNDQRNSDHPLAYSAGVVCLPSGEPFSLDLLISEADKRLYAVKNEKNLSR